MASLVFYLSVTVLFTQSTVAFNCSRLPVYVDIHKRAVHSSTTFQYGSFIGVGNGLENAVAAQNQSLWPSLSQNYTSFADVDYCDGGKSSLKSCEVSTGGFFRTQDSQTFIDGNNAYQGSDADRNGTFFGKVAQDTIRLYTHFFETDGAWQTLLPNSTIVVAANGSITPSIVGVGAESTVLKDLANRDMITGRMYSLYIGQGFDRANGAVNGSNTFGGYDAGRFKGDVHQYQMRPTINPFNVRVKDIVISDTNNPNGNTSLFNPSTAIFDAQITTDQFPLSLPYDVTQNFIKHMNAEQNNDWGDNSLKLKNPTTSTLSIVLEDGFTITLPPEMLANKSNITPIQNRDQNSTAPFLLSSAFLSQVYLMADYESYQFYLATAVQKNNAVMPTPWCPKSIPTAYERPKQSTFLQQGLIGAVIGGIVGGIALIAFAYCFVIALLRRRDEKKLEWNLENGKRETKMAQFQVEDVPEFDPPPKKAMMKFWGKI